MLAKVAKQPPANGSKSIGKDCFEIKALPASLRSLQLSPAGLGAGWAFAAGVLAGLDAAESATGADVAFEALPVLLFEQPAIAMEATKTINKFVIFIFRYDFRAMFKKDMPLLDRPDPGNDLDLPRLSTVVTFDHYYITRDDGTNNGHAFPIR